jgi:NADH:ubiquinone oxidoreductase subunit 5 (subunit L)/multisubunit Na+/H+ antiporter MnhA subunit
MNLKELIKIRKSIAGFEDKISKLKDNDTKTSKTIPSVLVTMLMYLAIFSLVVGISAIYSFIFVGLENNDVMQNSTTFVQISIVSLIALSMLPLCYFSEFWLKNIIKYIKKNKNKKYETISNLFNKTFNFKRKKIINETLISFTENENILLEEMIKIKSTINIEKIVLASIDGEDLKNYNPKDIIFLSNYITNKEKRFEILEQINSETNNVKIKNNLGIKNI